MHPSAASKIITGFIKREVRNRNSKGVVVGLSGGLDSSVAVILAAKALGPSRVLGLVLPEHNTVSKQQEIADALGLAKNLRIHHKLIEIGSAGSELARLLPANKFAHGNLVARLRMCVLYYYAGMRRLLVMGTSDRSELEIGYFTKYGDGAADILPIGGLYKTEVKEIGRFLQLPSQILGKKSTPGLWKGQDAEGELGLPYEEIDEILRELKRNGPRLATISTKKVQKVICLVEQNKHKRSMPPVCMIDNNHITRVGEPY
jgi:NAD+ synthase